ncbi:MAG: caspase family protein [Candidatus Cloacimonetes bacterium]|nr:caspase family protein [Candidatus Cloacimonadota bacterium]NLO43437.1 caspase family protein [Candidatus Cloacimonadota bacterium]
MKRYAIILLILMVSVGAFAQRQALVIGNSGYGGNELSTSLNDAQLVADAFAVMDYQVTLHKDLGYEEMYQAINEFKKGLKSHDVAVFYYAGYTKQVSGKNYLIPFSENKIKNLDDKLISVDVVLEALTRADYSFMFLESRQLPKGFFKSLCAADSGLAPIQKLGDNQGFAMAQQVGKHLTSQGVRYSIFTHSLMKFMGNDMRDFHDLLNLVQTEVKEYSNGKQVPYFQGNLRAPFTFWEPIQNLKYRFHMPLYRGLDGGGSYNF